jgi:putative transposase
VCKKDARPVSVSNPTWGNPESCLRVKIRGRLQDLLEAEVDELRGREKSERRKAVDAAPGYRNGFGKPRKLTRGIFQ